MPRGYTSYPTLKDGSVKQFLFHRCLGVVTQGSDPLCTMISLLQNLEVSIIMSIFAASE